MNYFAEHYRELPLGRIGRRHRSFRNQKSIHNRYELVQRIIIFMIIISCIALVATAIGHL